MYSKIESSWWRQRTSTGWWSQITQFHFLAKFMDHVLGTYLCRWWGWLTIHINSIMHNNFVGILVVIELCINFFSSHFWWSWSLLFKPSNLTPILIFFYYYYYLLIFCRNSQSSAYTLKIIPTNLYLYYYNVSMILSYTKRN